MTFDDLRSRAEHLDWDPTYQVFVQAILHARDARLLQILDGELVAAGPGPSRLAIVYGARHMRAVVSGLSKRGFHARRTEWLKVFNLH